jgi:hypothetical protein
LFQIHNFFADQSRRSNALFNTSAMFRQQKDGLTAHRRERMRPLEPTSPTERPGLTEQAAAAFVRRHGSGALTILQDRAETAEELGHRTAAKTWREMAAAAARLLRVDDMSPPPAAPVRGLPVHPRPLSRR